MFCLTSVPISFFPDEHDNHRILHFWSPGSFYDTQMSWSTCLIWLTREYVMGWACAPTDLVSSFLGNFKAIFPSTLSCKHVNTELPMNIHPSTWWKLMLENTTTLKREETQSTDPLKWNRFRILWSSCDKYCSDPSYGMIPKPNN